MVLHLPRPERRASRSGPAAPGRRTKRSRWAWTVLLTAPLFAALAVWITLFVLNDEAVRWWGDLVVLPLVFVPPLLSAVIGARSGNRSGVHAAALAASWIAFVVIFWLMANFAYSGRSGDLPIALGLIAGVAVAASVEGWYRPSAGDRSGGGEGGDDG